MATESKNLETQKEGRQQTIIINQTEQKSSNGMGTAGLVTSIIALVLCWVPVLGQVLGFIGVLLSFIGVFKSPRGMAVAGLVTSFINLLLQIFVIASIGAVLSMS